MPTRDVLSTFWNDYDQLTSAQQAQFRASLRVKRVRKVKGVYEMTWAPDGRATFEFGPPQVPGEVHVIWRRIGTHAILKQP